MKRNNLKGKRFSRETQRLEGARPRAEAAAGIQAEFPAMSIQPDRVFPTKSLLSCLLLAVNLINTSGRSRGLARQLRSDHLLRLHANDPVDQLTVFE
jgi:hypothetical protein